MLDNDKAETFGVAVVIDKFCSPTDSVLLSSVITFASDILLGVAVGMVVLDTAVTSVVVCTIFSDETTS